jgi:selenide, water dikinase
MKIDIAKRRRVMDRSQRLGHCICDAQRGCPCDVFRDQGRCPCAGERPDPADSAPVKLTTLVHNAGCASKIAPADLEAVLSRLPEVKDPAVVSGLAAGDDAAIYRLSADLCLVQTVDVFTPCVDDPRLFGRICAANCLSDIYAMGGTPRTALSILAYPSETLPGEPMFQMLAGAMETMAQARVALIGGHSLKDEEIKLGFAITGTIDPALAAALDQPQPGDVLVLTKPLGTGVLAFGRQIGRAHPSGLAAAEVAMAALNKPAAEAMIEAGASACTDITGFGLFGHLLRLVRQHPLAAEVYADALPAFDGVMEALQQGIVPGATERNREYVGEDIRLEPGIDEAQANLGFDAQTSGGLLIAIAPGRLERLQSALRQREVPAFVIGRLLASPGGQIALLQTAPTPGQMANPEISAAPTNQETPAMNQNSHSGSCCTAAPTTADGSSSASESQQAFSAFIKSVTGPGVLTEKTKELILFSLVVQSRCQPCFKAHHRRAQSLGITQAEMDEAAWCAIALGGAPVRMFYQECLASMGA